MLDANVDVYRAFVELHVGQCRHSSLGVRPGAPVWSDIRVVCETHDLWSAEFHERLSRFFVLVDESCEMLRKEREANEKSVASACDEFNQKSRVKD